MTSRVALLALLVAVAPHAARGDGATAACPPGTALREHAQEFACTTPEGVGEGPFWAVREDGSVQYRGTARAGRTHGTWTSWHPNGVRDTELAYRDGILRGPFRQWDADGKLRVEGRHDARGEMDGTWTRWWPNGRRRSAWEMRHGSAHGLVEAWWENGERKLRGSREAGRRVGRWTWWDEAGAVASQCRYADGAVVEGRCGGDAAE